MNTTTPAVRNLARRLIAYEAARDSDERTAAAVLRTCDKLRAPLAKLAGVAGFRSLMARALAIAKAEQRALDSVQVRSDGSLEGFDLIPPTQDVEAGVQLISHLIALLTTFIGATLTERLVRDAWPDVNVTEVDSESGAAS